MASEKSQRLAHPRFLFTVDLGTFFYCGDLPPSCGWLDPHGLSRFLFIPTHSRFAGTNCGFACTF